MLNMFNLKSLWLQRQNSTLSLCIFLLIAVPLLSFSINITAAKAETYSQVSINLELFLGKGGGNSKLLARVPNSIWDAVNTSLAEGHANFKKIKYKIVRHHLNEKDKKGVLLTPHKDHKENVSNFYIQAQKEWEEFYYSFCKKNKVDFLFLWSPDIEIDSKEGKVRVTMYTYFTGNNIAKPELLDLPINDKRRLIQEVGRTIHNDLVKIYTK
ncbi:MAG: hypothetical protein KJ550_03790 [Proteobacteria bacterium]|nr:hypothetical protein [Pseudomonadota bacterium]MBU4068314.1 hypothetical protein [Pseudomonadota bacterium]